MSRTPEEREAARIERERRRAKRRGDDPPAHQPSPATDIYDAAPAAPATEIYDAAPAAPAPEIRAARVDPPALVLAAHDGEEPLTDDQPDETFTEAPAGTRRVSGLQRGRFQRGGTSGGGHGTRGRPHAPPSLRGRIASLVAILLAAALIWFLIQLFQPFSGSGHGAVTVDIPAHSSSSQVGDLLQKDGVISSSFFFELRATLAGERGDLRPGRYHLKLGMSYGDVLTTLTKVPKPAKVTNLTITEGRTRRQINALLRSQGVRGSYLAATRHSRVLDPVHYGAPRSTPSLEGFLFPSTYQLREPIKLSALVSEQLQTFRQRFRAVNLRYASSKHLTAYDVLTIASMVEAESATAHDRPLVASVIYNRLRAGMPLQIDATTRYATGNYTRPLTVSQLNSSSPYNTRIHKGLPPTPIDNPGMASIDAAAHPAQTNFLYFVVKPCGNGEQSFTASYQQFQQLQAQYQAARAKRGGSPAHC